MEKDDPEQQTATTTNEPSIDKPDKPAPPPNGGTTAWLHVLGSFMLSFNTWGVLNTFGVYQTYYESGVLFTANSSDISWIGSLQSFLLLLVCFLTGPLFDRGHLRFLLCFGSFMLVFGHMMLSLCHAYWQVILAQGLVIGLGAGCLFVPLVAILPQYFSTRLGLATGLAMSGSSLGGVVYPIVLHRLIGEIGFPWAVRVVGFIALAMLLFPMINQRLRIKPSRVRALVNLEAFKDPAWMCFVLISLVAYMGLIVLLFYISYYAADRHITNSALSFYLVAVFNAGSVFGRTVPNALSDKTGPFNLLIPGSIITGVLMFCMMAVSSEAGIIVVAILAGFFSGILISILPLCFVALTRDMSLLGTRIGMGSAIAGLGILAGGPSGGAILGMNDALNWTGLWTFGGVCCTVGGFAYGVLRVVKFGGKLNNKA